MALRIAGMLQLLAGSALAMDAPGTSPGQDLEKLKAGNQVTAARWSKQADSYLLQVVLNGTPDSLGQMFRPRLLPPIETGEMLPGMVNVADALRKLVPQSPAGARAETCEDLEDLKDFRLCDTVRHGLGEEPALACKRIEVWLLKEDGTQIQSPSHNCGARPTGEVDFSYAFYPADGAQAVAVAVRVGEEFYIDKLQAE
jgi:hypothetical protein